MYMVREIYQAQRGKAPEIVAGFHILAELDRLKTEPISDHELQRTKNQFARDYILGRESNQQKAGQLSHAVVIHNDIKTADGEFDIFQNITVGDVQINSVDLKLDESKATVSDVEDAISDEGYTVDTVTAH